MIVLVKAMPVAAVAEEGAGLVWSDIDGGGDLDAHRGVPPARAANWRGTVAEIASGFISVDEAASLRR